MGQTEFFKTAKKCGMFGVCNDCTNVQVNYLINEEENTGKGADCIISLVHHYLENYGSGAYDVLLQADNCVGQNRNNCTMQYPVWCTITKRDLSVELSFMLTGHTSVLSRSFFFLLVQETLHALFCWYNPRNCYIGKAIFVEGTKYSWADMRLQWTSPGSLL